MRRQQLRLAIELAAAIFALTLFCSTAWAQGTYQVIFNFGEYPSQAYQPWSGVVLDAHGNIYGNTEWGGNQGNGTVYQLLRNNDGGWIYATLHSFGYYDPGSAPVTTLVRDQAGHLYGTNTAQVFELTPDTSVDWGFSALHNFTGGGDGACNDLCSVSMDSAGNLYGSTPAGGANGDGVIFKIGSSGFNVLYNFTGGDNGGYGVGQLAFDNQGNIYGTTVDGGTYGQGVFYRLSPSGTYTVLHTFGGSLDGAQPWGGLMMARDGNLYGTTANGGAGDSGTVFRLTPNNDGTWTESVLYSFRQSSGGFFPQAVPTMDAAGNLYGTTVSGGGSNSYGTVYKLTQSNGQWSETVVHAFQGPPNDGNTPIYVPVAIDSAGNIYGTTTMGGIYDGNGEGFGTVWEYTP
jgi:uncharacterized repeat protein (TIGR03803 family)